MPLPVLVREPVPLRMPPKLLLAMPVVKAALPRVTLPAPASEQRVSLLLFRLRVAPEATKTAHARTDSIDDLGLDGPAVDGSRTAVGIGSARSSVPVSSIVKPPVPLMPLLIDVLPDPPIVKKEPLLMTLPWMTSVPEPLLLKVWLGRRR